jgi:pyrimidine operon attenuation protein / uracil phosphoribosyltransferase
MADEYGLVEKSKIMDSARMKRALSRLASEIVEENQGAEHLYIVGIRRRGVPLAERIVEKIEQLENKKPLYGIIDITLYRDDLSTVGANPIVNRTELDTDIEGKIIVLVDDVLYTGRTIRSRTRTSRITDPGGFLGQNRSDETDGNHQSYAQRI